MPSGGHSRSGPAPDPRSGASDRKGLKFTDLPAEGYTGEIPDFPAAQRLGEEQKWWNWAWRTPQAALWATPQWSWVIPAVADWCRLKAQAEVQADCPTSVYTAIRQREGDILLSNDALLRAGYRVVTNQVAERQAEKVTRRKGARERHLEAVEDAAG